MNCTGCNTETVAEHAIALVSRWGHFKDYCGSYEGTNDLLTEAELSISYSTLQPGGASSPCTTSSMISRQGVRMSGNQKAAWSPICWTRRASDQGHAGRKSRVLLGTALLVCFSFSLPVTKAITIMPLIFVLSNNRSKTSRSMYRPGHESHYIRPQKCHFFSCTCIFMFTYYRPCPPSSRPLQTSPPSRHRNLPHTPLAPIHSLPHLRPGIRYDFAAHRANQRVPRRHRR